MSDHEPRDGVQSGPGEATPAPTAEMSGDVADSAAPSKTVSAGREASGDVASEPAPQRSVLESGLGDF